MEDSFKWKNDTAFRAELETTITECLEEAAKLGRPGVVALGRIMTAAGKCIQGEVAKETAYRLKHEKECRERLAEISRRVEFAREELDDINIVIVQEQLSHTECDPNLTIIT